MSKLYHVVNTKHVHREQDPTTIVSSWPSEAQAVLAARHYVIDQSLQSSWSYNEVDEADEFRIEFDTQARLTDGQRSQGLGSVAIRHSVEPKTTASKDKFEPLLWGVFLQNDWHDYFKREILIGDTFYPSLYQANTVARKEAWTIMKEFCDCAPLLEERTGIKDDPTGKHHFGQHGPIEKNKRSETRCYSVKTDWSMGDNDKEFLLHVRPVRLAKEPPLKEKRKREGDDSKGSSRKKARGEEDTSSRESSPDIVENEDDGYTYYG